MADDDGGEMAEAPRDASTPPSNRSVQLTIFCHCGSAYFSSRNGLGSPPGNQPSTVLTEDLWVHKGLAMLIRSATIDVQGKAARAAGPDAIVAVSLPTLLLGGLLLICP